MHYTDTHGWSLVKTLDAKQIDIYSVNHFLVIRIIHKRMRLKFQIFNKTPMFSNVVKQPWKDCHMQWNQYVQRLYKQ